ncbi:MAG: formyl transferase [marine bacterium B5-7]|nr:MAG: formyl transferase [marine bacterium B5-7]
MLCDAISLCAKFGHEPVFIATAPAPHNSQEYHFDIEDIQQFAKKSGCNFAAFPSASTSDCIRQASECGAEIIISLNWPVIFTAQHLATFPFGIINAHCGDLPRYRGNACPNWAIINGEAEVVLTFHRMSEGLDSGPWYKKIAFPLGPEIYIGDVYDFLSMQIPKGFASLLDDIASGRAEAIEQTRNPSSALRCYPRLPEDGQVDWSQNVETVHRLVRASSRPFHGAFCHFADGTRITIWRAYPFKHEEPFCAIPGQVLLRIEGDPVIACGMGALRLEEVEAKNYTSAETKKFISSSLRTRLY